jgi:molecular chaperone GrpE
MHKKDVKNSAENPENGNNVTIDINADADVPGTEHLSEPVEKEDQATKLEAEIAGWKDKYVRLMAEFDNFRKRNAKEKLEMVQNASEAVINNLLEVLDDAERAQKQIETSRDINEIKSGITLVFNKLRNTLQARGLKEMQSLNEAFNPDLHDAISEIPAPKEELKGRVVAEVAKGYYLNDKILRHAKVVVGK